MSFSNCPEGCFPSLKVLDIRADDSDPHHPNFIQNLLTCCPVLEDLRIDATLGDYSINISAPQLKILGISMTDSSVIFFINAPKLEKVVISDNWFRPNNYLFENGKSLINVNFNSKLMFMDLLLAGLLILLLCLQKLPRSPNLKHLVLERKSCNGEDELEWNFFLPPELPGWLVSHLQTISIKKFKGQLDEMKMVEFLLKNGHVLNTVSIQTVDKGLVYTKEELYKKLLTYKRVLCHLGGLKSSSLAWPRFLLVSLLQSALFSRMVICCYKVWLQQACVCRK